MPGDFLRGSLAQGTTVPIQNVRFLTTVAREGERPSGVLFRVFPVLFVTIH